MDISHDSLHDLLSQVASGRIDPAEAARLLDDTEPVNGDAGQFGSDSQPGVKSVHINAKGVNLRVIADPTVATAVAEGPHAVSVNGTTLNFELPRAEGSRVEQRPRLFGRIPMGWSGGTGERIVMRVNPDLPMTLNLVATSADVVGLRSALDFSVVSGSLKMMSHAGPLNGRINTGSAKIVARLVGGESRISCDLGSLDLRLLEGSDVKVSANAEMGSVKIVGGGAGASHGHESSIGMAGGGQGSLDIAVRMGSARVVIA